MTSSPIAKLGLLVTLLFVPFVTYADWTELGAQYKCDPQRSLISFMAYEESSSGYRTVVPRGYKVLKAGDQTLTCRTKGGTMRSTVRVLLAGPGECMGSGAVLIKAIVIEGKDVIARERALLNFQCVYTDYYLSRLDVQVLNRPAIVTRCVSHVFQPTNELGCSDESVMVP